MADAFLKANLGESEVEAVALILERTKSLLLDAKKLLPADKADQILEGWTQLKNNFLKKIFGYLATCEFWLRLGWRFWIFVGYVDFLTKFGAKLDFRV